VGLAHEHLRSGSDPDVYKRAVQEDIRGLPALQHALWEGQFHGSNHDMVHTRHMRPFCERFRSKTDLDPHLHWETKSLKSDGDTKNGEQYPGEKSVSSLVLFVSILLK